MTQSGGTENIFIKFFLSNSLPLRRPWSTLLTYMYLSCNKFVHCKFWIEASKFDKLLLSIKCNRSLNILSGQDLR